MTRFCSSTTGTPLIFFAANNSVNSLTVVQGDTVTTRFVMMSFAVNAISTTSLIGALRGAPCQRQETPISAPASTSAA
jgi:hypothetical protein